MLRQKPSILADFSLISWVPPWFFFFFFQFREVGGWPSSTSGISQIWLKVRVEGGKFWDSPCCGDKIDPNVPNMAISQLLPPNLANLDKIIPKNS